MHVRRVLTSRSKAPGTRRPLSGLALSALAALSLAACATASPAEAPATAAVAPPPQPVPAPRYEVLLLNGGGNKDINYQAHVVALAELRKLMLDAGVPSERISILSGDGADPAPDLALREPDVERAAWLLAGTRLERLRAPIVYESSSIAGAALVPATKLELAAFFARAKARLGPGDTLLIDVTDHGTRGGADPRTNAITLWGDKQSITAAELGDMIAQIDPGVRVVMWMSQCYSGGFAALASRPGQEGAPRPTTCGYFSSTADRPAYGCFPENVGRATVGYAHDFTRALAATRRMDAAHARVLSADRTPDVPIRSSDVYLDEVLRKAASDRALTVEALGDELLAKAPPDRTLLTAIAGAFGLAAPPSFADVARQQAALDELGRGTEASIKAWRGALSDATSDTLAKFLAAHPPWEPKLADPAVRALDGAAARALSTELLAELRPFAQAGKGERIEQLWARADAVSAIAYRAEARRAALLRMRVLLTGAAARAYLAAQGTLAERSGYAALLACEDLSFAGTPTPDAEPVRPAFAALAEDVKAAHEAHPSWIGISFTDIAPAARKKRTLPEGASMVTGMYPDSPAKAGGVQVGDIVVGPQGGAFSSRREIRAWTMLSPAEQAASIDVMRGEQKLSLSLVPRLLPVDLAPMPVAPAAAVESPAPALDLRYYRGSTGPSLTDGRPRLLYFWATWCGPCKAALPELTAFERANKAQVIAITDEDAETLDGFFKKWKQPFPKTVAVDELRKAFLAYGASGTPTFVLIDGKGVVRSRKVGYTKGKGIGVDGWTWSGK